MKPTTLLLGAGAGFAAIWLMSKLGEAMARAAYTATTAPMDNAMKQIEAEQKHAVNGAFAHRAHGWTA